MRKRIFGSCLSSCVSIILLAVFGQDTNTNIVLAILANFTIMFAV